ncbi:MAG: hypothetical protein PHW28_11785, partial [Mesotoga sp.]|nr:hypothetical protein [Mesotoga sp.]
RDINAARNIKIQGMKELGLIANRDKNRRTYGDSLVNLVSIETTTQESTGLALCERQLYM